MTIQGNTLFTSNIFGAVSTIAKNSGNSGVSAFDSSKQLQPQIVNRDIVTISGGGGKQTTVTTKTVQSLVIHGAYNPYDFEEKYNADDALLFNFAVSVRPDIDQVPGRNIQLTGVKSNIDGFNLIIPENLNVINTDFLKKHETVAGLDKNMTIDEFLAHVQKNGLDKNINWTNVAETLSFDSGNVNAKTFSQYTDYAAAVYASLENRIMNDFTGEEQKAQLAKLNEVFTAKTQEFKDIFFNNSLSWLKDYEGENYVKGQSEDKLKASIEAVFTEKINNFRNIAANNPDFAGIKGAENEWLERDVRFMANKLMEAAGSTSSSSGLISEKDLIDMSRLQEAFNFKTSYDSRILGGEVDEEMVGFVVGSKVLKGFYLADQNNMSEKVRDTLQKMADKFIESEFERFYVQNESLIRNFGASNLTKKQYSSLEKEAVLNIINNLLNEYNKSKNALVSLQKTATYAQNIHTQKAQSDEYSNLIRYGSTSINGLITSNKNGSFYWQNFYELKQAEHPYSPLLNRPSMANIVTDWETFIKTF